MTQTRPKHENRDRRALAYGLGAVVLWSTVATAFKLSLTSLTPLQLVTFAAGVSWVFFLLVSIMSGGFRQLQHANTRDISWCLGIGLLNPALYYCILFAAYARLPAQEAMALNYTWALTLPLLAAVLLGQRLRIVDMIAASISYTGVLIIATRGDIFEFQLADPLGIGLAMGSTLIWGLYWIANTRHQLAPTTALFLNFSAAVPVLMVAMSISGQFRLVHDGSTDLLRGLTGALYIGCFEMGVSFVLWLKAMRLTTHSATLSTLIFLSPPLSLLLIWLVLDEPIQGATLGGLGFILTGLLVQHWPAPRRGGQTP